MHVRACVCVGVHVRVCVCMRVQGAGRAYFHHRVCACVSGCAYVVVVGVRVWVSGWSWTC